MQTPMSDALPTILHLEPYSLANSHWDGIESIGPITLNGEQMASDAVRAWLEFSPYSDGSCPTYIIDSNVVVGRGLVGIDSAPLWMFSVAPQRILLTQGLWYWSFKVTDTEDITHSVYAGRFVVRP